MDVTNGRGYVYSIQYHMVWCVKYRHKVLNGQVEIRLIEILQQIASDNGFQIVEINTDKDHIHLLVNCSPQHYIPNMMKALKGVSPSTSPHFLIFNIGSYLFFCMFRNSCYKIGWIP